MAILDELLDRVLLDIFSDTFFKRQTRLKSMFDALSVNFC